MRCPKGHENRAGAAFCLECGARLALVCSSCGRDLPAAARFCDGCGAAVSAAAEPASAAAEQQPAYAPPPHLAAKIERERGVIEGERRVVTCLFIDAVGSTAAGDRLDAEDLHHLVHACTDKMIEAVNRFEGTVTQFRGDGIMAIFGAPIAHEDSARRAVAAALAMRDTLREHAAEMRAQGKPALAFRIGLNTGPVVVGTIGSDFTMDYTAVGDTVNLAARMEQWAPPWAIYLTDNTSRHVGAYYELRDLGRLEVRGKSEAVQAYEVIRELPARSRLEASAARGLTPYVGRSEQLESLLAHFAEVQRGAGHVVFITGEPGMGKSRLLLEFRRKLPPGTSWFEGRCISWGRTFPYLPIVDIARSAFGIDEGEDDASVIAKINEGTRDWDEAARDSAVPQLKHLLNVSEAGSQALDPQDRRRRTLDALKALLMQECRRGPFVIVVEDMHWADEQSEEALTALVDAVASLPVLMIVTYRPGYQHPLGDRTYYARLALRNLAPSDSASMVRGVLQASGIPVQLQEMIVAKAEGNPFFIEEVSRALIESGALRRAGDRYILARPVEEVTIPDTVQEVILSRIDRLQRRAKEAVQYASVIGREFPVRLLKHIHSAEESMDSLLNELKSLELIYEKSYFPELEYMFKHALTQEVALSTLLGDRRKALHRTVAAAIEELYAERLAEQHEALAYHYFEGEEWEKACDYATRVAERAQELHAPRAVIDHVTRAIEAARRCDPECCANRLDPGLYRMRGRAYDAIGEFDLARADFEAALSLAQERSETESEWNAHADLGMLWAGRDYSRTGEHYRQAYEMARASGDERLIAHSLNRLGNWSGNVERSMEAVQYHTEALMIFERLGDVRGIAESLDFMAMAEALGGDLQRATELGARALDLFRQLDDRQRVSGLLASYGLFSQNVQSLTMGLAQPQGEPGMPPARKTEALEIARAIGFKSGEAFAHLNLSGHYTAIGAYRDAFASAREGMAIATEIEHRQWITSMHFVLGHQLLEVLAYEEAIQHLEAGLRLADAIGSQHWINSIAAGLALAYVRADRIEAAAHLLDERLPRETPATTIGQRSLWVARAELEIVRGRHDAALSAIDLLVRYAKNLGRRGLGSIPTIAWLQGRAQLGLGRVDSASAMLDDALENARRLGLRGIEWRTLESIATLRKKQGREADQRKAAGEAIDIIEDLARELDDQRLRDGFLHAPEIQRLRELAEDEIRASF